ncbi:hypothetical protein FB567DRAFT_589302 [Paraphoma chrysanthemicola]|uniref:Uncharacterized protein n=1 Tax=Paraphoma chrysanthemicola TaxID=798071 RepID=A0A8K0RCA8_9PLEO|nr:hypothetical protein FB567DRAFT_589302 [Paraphoma chrysanthemicola]
MTLVVKPRTSNNEVPLTLIGTEVTVGAVAREVGVGGGELVDTGGRLEPGEPIVTVDTGEVEGADNEPGVLGALGADGEAIPVVVEDNAGIDAADEDPTLLELGSVLDDGLEMPDDERREEMEAGELLEAGAGDELREGSETVLAGALEPSAADVERVGSEVERKEALLRVGVVAPDVLKVGEVLLDTLALEEPADTETLDGGRVLMPNGLALLIRDVDDDAEVEVPETPDELPIDVDVLLELGKLNVDKASDLVAVVSVWMLKGLEADVEDSRLKELEERLDDLLKLDEPVRLEDMLKLERLTKVEEALLDDWLIGLNELVGSGERLGFEVTTLRLVVVRTPDRVNKVWDVLRPLLEDDDILTGGIGVLNATDELVDGTLETRLLERKEDVSLMFVELTEVRLSDIEEVSGGAPGIELVDRVNEADAGGGGTPS